MATHLGVRSAWRHSVPLCVLVWVGTRAGIVLLGWLAAPNFVGDELGLYESWGQALLNTGGVSGDSWQYPPLVAPLLWASSGSGLMPWSFVALALVVDAFILGLLIRLRRQGGSWLGPWFWAVAAIIIGPAIFAKLDIFPAAFALLAIAAASHPIRSGVFAAVGTVLKVWPAFVLVAVPKDRSLRAIASWGVSTLAISGVIAAIWPSTLDFVTNQSGRGLEAQSIWAYPFLVAKAFGQDASIAFRFGAFEVDSPLAEWVASLVTGLLLISIAAGVWLWLTGRFDRVAGAESALLVVLVSLLLSRVLSPQFNVWIVALAAMFLLQVGRPALTIVALISASSLITQMTYVVGYENLRDGQALAVVLHGGRIGLLVAATVMLAVRVARTWSRDDPAAPGTSAPAAGRSDSP